MASAWHKLPFEVLINIFEHNVNHDQYIQSRRDFYNYQLVCKGWSKAAQSFLYRHINCQGSNESDEQQRFVKFIHTIKVLAPQVGPFIKSITVLYHLGRLQAPLAALDAIFANCPKLEEFYCNGASKEIAWPYLLALPDERLSKIRSILQKKDLRHFQPPLYPELALKLKKSLSQLHYVNIPQDPTLDTQCLIDGLSQFKSLQQLSLIECQLQSYDQLFEVIDTCSPTVSKLSIHKYVAMSAREPSTDEIKAHPNDTIKEITISRGVLDSIICFASKFKNLQKLSMEQATYVGQRDPSWIRGLTDVCCSLLEYKITFNLSLEGDVKDNCVDLVKRSSPTDTFLMVDYIGEPEDTFAAEEYDYDPSWGITVKKEGSRSGIEVRLQWMDRELEEDIDDEFEYHMHWLDSYAPTHIIMKNLEPTDFMYSELEFEHFSDATTASDFAIRFRDVYRHPLIEARAWTILTKALFSTADITDAIVSFSFMIIPNLNGRTKHLEKSSNPHIKQLTFENTVLYHQVLPVISSWLPTLDTLTLNTCFILMEDPYTLKINMPDTKLQHVKIVAGRLRFVHGLPHVCTIGRYQFRNTDLLRALSPGQQYTLRMDANGKSLAYNVHNNIKTPLQYQDDENWRGTGDNFLIWVICKELEDVSIVDGSSKNGLKHLIKA